MEGHQLIVAFDTDSPEFVRGFEAGRVYGRLRSEEEWEVAETVHISNVEMMMRIGEALHRDVRSEEADDRWMRVIFGPVRRSTGEG